MKTLNLFSIVPILIALLFSSLYTKSNAEFHEDIASPYQCEMLAKAVYINMAQVVTTELNHVSGEDVWAFKFSSKFTVMSITDALVRSLRVEGATLQTGSNKAKYLDNGVYMVVNNYTTNGTTCSVAITGNRFIWISYGPHRAG